MIAKAKGASEIVFGVDRVNTAKWPAREVRQRYETIIKPGPVLAGLPSREGDNPGVVASKTSPRALAEFLRSGGTIEPLRSVLEPRSVRYTVTIRDSGLFGRRNSNVEAWREFAAEIRAVVIEDYDKAPISLHERMALYAGAEMNFGVVNGPMGLLGLTDYPLMVFRCWQDHRIFAKCGIERGEKAPWLGPNQHMIWDDDDLPTIRREFRRLNG